MQQPVLFEPHLRPRSWLVLTRKVHCNGLTNGVQGTPYMLLYSVLPYYQTKRLASPTEKATSNKCVNISWQLGIATAILQTDTLRLCGPKSFTEYVLHNVVRSAGGGSAMPFAGRDIPVNTPAIYRILQLALSGRGVRIGK